ncbi:MAG: DUF883 C-terminal domain-containing protein [Proteobacteria bacterium]|nr:DUF883 C-terminal domain-containing protein [Pseudomonadota bacterium]
MTITTAHRLKSVNEEAAVVQAGEKMVSDTSAKARELTDSAVREITDMMASMKARLKDLGVDTDQMLETAKDSASSVEKRIAEEVVERPLRSLAIAAGIGLALGFLTRK